MFHRSRPRSLGVRSEHLVDDTSGPRFVEVSGVGRDHRRAPIASLMRERADSVPSARRVVKQRVEFPHWRSHGHRLPKRLAGAGVAAVEARPRETATASLPALCSVGFPVSGGAVRLGPVLSGGGMQ